MQSGHDLLATEGLKRRRAVVVGASRGIGAAVSLRLARAGCDVVLTYRSHQRRAEAVADQARRSGVSAWTSPLDTTSEPSRDAFAEWLGEALSAVDYFVMSASGGLEAGQPSSYAFAVNARGPAETAARCLPIIQPGGTFVFLTSHEAHFFGQRPPFTPYREIAESKRQGETQLLAMRAQFDERRVGLNIVTAELVADSYTAKILERRSPGLLAEFSRQPERLSTSDSVAAAVVDCCVSPRSFGSVVFDPPMESALALRGGAVAAQQLNSQEDAAG